MKWRARRLRQKRRVELTQMLHARTVGGQQFQAEMEALGVGPTVLG